VRLLFGSLRGFFLAGSTLDVLLALLSSSHLEMQCKLAESFESSRFYFLAVFHEKNGVASGGGLWAKSASQIKSFRQHYAN